MAMDDRKQRVLTAIVSLYSADGEPVGSTLLSRYFDMAVSSATLRNEMAALTKLGLLEQPHTSAGRVPSAKGYRYYLDQLMEQHLRLSQEDKALVEGIFRELDYDPDQLADGAAKALADLLGCAVVVSTPRAEDVRIAHYELIQVGRSNVAVLAVTSAGGVRTRVARLDRPVDMVQLQKLAQVLAVAGGKRRGDLAAGGQAASHLFRGTAVSAALARTWQLPAPAAGHFGRQRQRPQLHTPRGAGSLRAAWRGLGARSHAGAGGGQPAVYGRRRTDRRHGRDRPGTNGLQPDTSHPGVFFTAAG